MAPGCTSCSTGSPLDYLSIRYTLATQTLVYSHRRRRLGVSTAGAIVCGSLGAQFRVSPPWVHNGLTLVIPSFVHAVQGRLGACHSHRRHWLGVSTADAVRLGVCSALTLVSPPRVHTRDPVVRARSAGQAGGLPFSPQPPVGCLHRRRGRPGMLGVASSALTLVSPPRVHARDPVVRARRAGQDRAGQCRAVQGRNLSLTWVRAM